MYNYPGTPGYNAPPGYGGAPGMAPPGMGPPGAAPPGVGAPPGAAMGQGPPALGGPRPLPQGWQPPANMPTFNFNAPVIRLGTQGGKPMESPVGGRRDNAGAPPARRGLGMDRDGDRRDGSQQVIPLSREEIARTIFVGNIPDGVGGDEGMERILETAGKLVRWTRATDANNKLQTFGFAEFADAQSLETAAEIFSDVQVPTKRQKPGEKKEEDEEVETTKLQVMVDDASIKYAEEWKERRNEDENTIQFRLDTAKEALAGVLASFFNPPNIQQTDYAGDTAMQDAPAQDGDVEVAFVNLATGEDELADIPAEMREIVAAEIAAFRDRSNQRDRERLRREEEIEAEERRRNGRRTSPPPSSAPTGPGGANGIPLGPRADRGVQGAPSGPKGSQFPRDYQGGVNFVNGGAVNGGVYVDREDDDDSASDSELERRRKKKRDDELDDAYQKQLSRWLKLESRTVSSLGRTSDRVKNQEAEQQAARDAEAKRLEEFDDDHEASTRRHIYYRDHGEYMREREKVRDREAKDDSFDRQQEQREQAAQNKQKEHARGQADAFLDQQAEEILRTQEPHEPAQQFKISLGGAAKKLEKTTAPRRTAADVEDLLEDEEPADQAGTKKRTLIPINYDAAVRANLTEEEVLEAQKQLARDIPSDKDGLWKWPVSWTHLPEKHIDKDIRVWTADKALQLTGVQDEDLVDVVVAHLRKKGGPQALVEDLEPVLDEEAESLVKKLWRMIIFFTETEKRGIK